MANKKVSQLTSKPSVLTTDLFPIADPTTGQLYKTTISDLGTAIGSGVSSVNGLVGAVVLDTDDIQELVSPTNKWFTDTRARAALSASSPLTYNSGTGAFGIQVANGLQNGYLSSADWTTFNAKQAALNGTGFVKISGTTISYDNSTYLTTSAAATNYVPYTGATANVNLGLNYSLTAALIIKSGGTSTQFLKADGSIDTNTYLTTGLAASTYLPLTGGTLTGDLTLSSTNPRLYFTDTDNNPDYFISNTDGTFTVYDVTNSTARFTIGTTGNGIFGGNLTVGQIIRSGGTSAQFLKADGSVDSSTYLTTSSASSSYLALAGGTMTGNLFLPANNTIGGTNYYLGQIMAGTDIWKIYGNSVATDQGELIFEIGDNGSPLASGGQRYRFWYNTLTNAKDVLIIDYNASIFNTTLTADSFIKSGGTSIQFLKADGSVDSNTYLTTSSASSTYLPLSGGTLTGALSGTSALFSGTFEAGRTGGAVTAGDLSVDTTSTSAKVIIGRLSTTGSDNTTLIGRNRVGVQGWSIDSFGAASFGSTLAVTGAATFSSGVTAAQLYTNSNAAASGFMQFNYATSNTSSRSWRLANDNVVYGDFAIQQSTTQTGTTFSNLLYINPSGNVGIGTTSPSYPLTVGQAGSTADSYIQIASTTTGTGNLFFGDTNGQGTGSYAGYIQYQHSSDSMVFGTSNFERMRITSGGDLRVGTTTEPGAGSSTTGASLGNSGFIIAQRNGATVGYFGRGTNDGELFAFYRSTTQVGSISVTTVMTSYNVTSDYRLKEDLKPINGLDIVNKIKVYDYKWKADNSRMDGVLAHELQEVLPYAVTGVKDGEQMQSVDYSKIVPVMVQAIKELKAELDTLKNK